MTASVIAYQNVRRTRIDLIGETVNLVFLEDVTDSADGMNQFLGVVTVNLLAQVIDININNVGLYSSS